VVNFLNNEEVYVPHDLRRVDGLREEVLMKYPLRLTLIVTIGLILFSSVSEAAQQTVNIRLTGKYCGFYEIDVARELKQVPGVTEVDFETMRGHVYVTMIAGKVHPNALLAAIRRVRGDGYYCKGQFEGEPGKIERY
jgi:hypothetical protein